MPGNLNSIRPGDPALIRAGSWNQITAQARHTRTRTRRWGIRPPTSGPRSSPPLIFFNDQGVDLSEEAIDDLKVGQETILDFEDQAATLFNDEWWRLTMIASCYVAAGGVEGDRNVARVELRILNGAFSDEEMFLGPDEELPSAAAIMSVSGAAVDISGWRIAMTFEADIFAAFGNVYYKAYSRQSIYARSPEESLGITWTPNPAGDDTWDSNKPTNTVITPSPIRTFHPAPWPHHIKLAAQVFDSETGYFSPLNAALVEEIAIHDFTMMRIRG
jgi:hypothetical protein